LNKGFECGGVALCDRRPLVFKWLHGIFD
jgi:hypothetical protein